jgi:hypothetical protein
MVFDWRVIAKNEETLMPNIRHGHARVRSLTPTYISWRSMWQRVKGQLKHAARDGYTELTICPRWQLFDNFLADMGERPAGKTLDRIKNELGYMPSNCRWATLSEQAKNHRYSKRTHCKRGHPLVPGNLRYRYRRDGLLMRQCLICFQDAQKRNNEKHRHKKSPNV